MEPLEVGAARDRILSLLAPLAAEEAPVEEALGRCLCGDVVAARTLPPWDNSAMDGYAVRSGDVPGRLTVLETIFAGGQPTREVGPGTCARIMTGAPVPRGADAVVMQEKTRPSGEGVEILEPVAPGASVRKAGEDARAGEALLKSGTALGVPEAGLLWGQGLTRVRVHRRPRVALISTGDELTTLGEALPNRIIDTNGPSLGLMVRRAGGVPTSLGIARDTLEDVRTKLAQAEGYDVVLTSAGVSVGERDFVREALGQLGVTLSFWRVAMRPGKPLAVGRKGDTLFAGLPGNPTSSLVTFELFVRPALRRLLGHADVAPTRIGGRCAAHLKKAPGLTHFVRVTARWKDGALWAEPLSSQTSGALASAAQATHLLVFPPSAERLSPGDPVELLPVSWAAASV